METSCQHLPNRETGMPIAAPPPPRNLTPVSSQHLQPKRLEACAARQTYRLAADSSKQKSRKSIVS